MTNCVYILRAAPSEETNGLGTHTDELGNSGYLVFKSSKAVGRGKWLWNSMLEDKAYGMEKVLYKIRMGPHSLCDCLVARSHYGEELLRYNKKW
jgi:hypothetical protein